MLSFVFLHHQVGVDWQADRLMERAKEKLAQRGLILECSRCSGFRSDRVELERHFLDKHTPLRKVPYFCQPCGNRYRRKTSLRSHLSRRHRGEDRATLTAGCGGTFTLKTRHYRTLSEEDSLQHYVEQGRPKSSVSTTRVETQHQKMTSGEGAHCQGTVAHKQMTGSVDGSKEEPGKALVATPLEASVRTVNDPAADQDLQGFLETLPAPLALSPTSMETGRHAKDPLGLEEDLAREVAVSSSQEGHGSPASVRAGSPQQWAMEEGAPVRQPMEEATDGVPHHVQDEELPKAHLPPRGVGQQEALGLVKTQMAQLRSGQVNDDPAFAGVLMGCLSMSKDILDNLYKLECRHGQEVTAAVGNLTEAVAALNHSMGEQTEQIQRLIQHLDRLQPAPIQPAPRQPSPAPRQRGAPRGRPYRQDWNTFKHRWGRSISPVRRPEKRRYDINMNLK